tara:strand:+ start:28 stop:381 length:354 start_codon:yes stop_codon:yes gene_type:complete
MSCSSYAVRINLSSHVLGDKWVGIPVIGPILVNGSQPASTLARVRMQFNLGTNTFTLDSDVGSEIAISNATTWEATVAQTQSFLTVAGQWSWSMQFYATGDTNPQTFYYGTFLVEEI